VKKTIPFLLIGLAVFVIYLYFIGMNEILESIRRANPFYYSLAFVTLLLDVFFSSLAWKYFLLPLDVKTSYSKSFIFLLIGNFVDILIPAESISGDLSKTYLMSRSSGESTGKIVASVVSHRIVSMIIVFSSLFISSTFFVIVYELPSLVLTLLVILLAGTLFFISVILAISIRGEKMIQKMADLLIRFFSYVSRGRWSSAGLRPRVKETIGIFHQGISVLGSNPIKLILPIIFTLISWIFSLLTSLLVFISLNYHISLSIMVIVYSVSGAIQSIPLGIPGEMGLTEIAMTSLYALLSVPVNIAAAVTVLTRVVTMWFKLFIGFLATQWTGLKILSEDFE
jgi:uncharacterized protein (TIRG00374 family)